VGGRTGNRGVRRSVYHAETRTKLPSSEYRFPILFRPDWSIGKFSLGVRPWRAVLHGLHVIPVLYAPSHSWILQFMSVRIKQPIRLAKSLSYPQSANPATLDRTGRALSRSPSGRPCSVLQISSSVTSSTTPSLCTRPHAPWKFPAGHFRSHSQWLWAWMLPHPSPLKPSTLPHRTRLSFHRTPAVCKGDGACWRRWR